MTFYHIILTTRTVHRALWSGESSSTLTNACYAIACSSLATVTHFLAILSPSARSASFIASTSSEPWCTHTLSLIAPAMSEGTESVGSEDGLMLPELEELTAEDQSVVDGFLPGTELGRGVNIPKFGIS